MMPVTRVHFPPNPVFELLLFPEARGKLMKFNVSEMPQFGSSWYKSDRYQNELQSVLGVVIYQCWDARKRDSNLFSSSTNHCLTKFNLNVRLCKFCPDILCTKPEYHLFSLIFGTYHGIKFMMSPSASLLQNPFT